MTQIRDDQWSQLYPYLYGRPAIYVGNETQCRRFLEGVHWMMRTGAQWRELPARSGNWNSVSQRFARWCDKAGWAQLHLHFAHDPDRDNLSIDSTIVRAQPCAAGAATKPGGKPPKRWAAGAVASAPTSLGMWMRSAIPCASC
jgi:transposase